MATPEVDHEAVQQWLDNIDWSYDPSRIRQCHTCSFGFTPIGPSICCSSCASACPHDGPTLIGHTVAINGAKAPHKLCFLCGRLVSLRKGAGPGLYCLKDNRRLQTVPPCARCGSTDGVELHHWAPRAIFGIGEAERWPTSYLCPECHQTWHTEMKRANGVRLPSDQRIDDTFTFDVYGETA